MRQAIVVKGLGKRFNQLQCRSTSDDYGGGFVGLVADETAGSFLGAARCKF